MLYTNASDIDFTKHKRLFVIGCSFTSWIWPTWADAIHKEHPHLEFRNFGTAGCGNDYMLTMLSQLTHEYALGEEDLVMIMWSSFHRLSSYRAYNTDYDLKEAIINPASALTEHDIHPVTWNWRSQDDHLGQLSLNTGPSYQSFCDRGFLIRDLAVIDTVTTVMEQSAYSGAYMLSVAVDKQDVFDTTSPKTWSADVLKLYNHIHNKQLGSALFDFTGFDQMHHAQIHWAEPHPADDYHPTAIQYCNYLKELGFSISTETELYCKHHDDKVDATLDAQILIDDPNWHYDFRNGNQKYPL